MSKLPPIPPEQRTFKGERPDIDQHDAGPRDETTGLQSSQPGDDDVNIEQQGRQANTFQNIRPQWKTQNR